MRKLLVGIMLSVASTPLLAQAKADGPVEVPLRVMDGRLVVPVTGPDGAEYDFLLSTSPMTVLSETGAARLGNGDGLTLGGIPLPSGGNGTVPDVQLTVGGKTLAGMVGANLLNQFNVLIDAPRHRLALKPVGRAVSWDGVTLSDPVRLQVLHGVVVRFEVGVNGRTYGATLDLGTPTLVVNRGLQSDTGIDDADVLTMRIAGATLADLPVRVRDLDIFQRWSPNGDGFLMVGSAVTLDCALAISWFHREIRTCVR